MSAKKSTFRHDQVQFYCPRAIGTTLQLYSIDYIEIGEQKLKSIVYKSPFGVDLFLWTNQQEKILKLKLNYLGNVVEWNYWEGVKTGFQELKEESEAISYLTDPNYESYKKQMSQNLNTIIYDKKPHQSSIDQMLELISFCQSLEIETKESLLKYLKTRKRNSAFEIYLYSFLIPKTKKMFKTLMKKIKKL